MDGQYNWATMWSIGKFGKKSVGITWGRENVEKTSAEQSHLRALSACLFAFCLLVSLPSSIHHSASTHMCGYQFVAIYDDKIDADFGQEIRTDRNVICLCLTTTSHTHSLTHTIWLIVIAVTLIPTVRYCLIRFLSSHSISAMPSV